MANGYNWFSMLMMMMCSMLAATMNWKRVWDPSQQQIDSMSNSSAQPNGSNSCVSTNTRITVMPLTRIDMYLLCWSIKTQRTHLEWKMHCFHQTISSPMRIDQDHETIKRTLDWRQDRLLLCHVYATLPCIQYTYQYPVVCSHQGSKGLHWSQRRGLCCPVLVTRLHKSQTRSHRLVKFYPKQKDSPQICDTANVPNLSSPYSPTQDGKTAQTRGTPQLTTWSSTMVD